MGFFFTQAAQVKRPSRQQRNAESLHRIGCAACPLNKARIKSPKMGPTLAKETLILFIGEAPGVLEDSEGKPFVGPSGQLLRKCVPNEMADYCSFDNIINCRPPDNRNPEWNEIQCCNPRRIKVIEQAKPKLIVGLGAFAQQWMLNSADQTGMRGRVFAVKIGSHSCYFMPTYHPARIIHSASEQTKKQGRRFSNDELLRTYFGRTFKLDLEKAFKLVESLEPPVIETESDIRKSVITFDGPGSRGTGIPCKEPTLGSTPSRSTTQFDNLLELLAKAKKAPVKAIDIETDRLRPYGKLKGILTIGVSFNTTNFSFGVDHPNSQWTKSQRDRILAIVADIIYDDTIKIAHNVPFELEWFIHYFGKEIVKHEVWECTQLQAHFLDERRGAGQSDDDSRRATYQSLDFLVKMHFGISFKEKFKVDRKNMAQADLAEVLVYNAADTLFTLRLWHRQTALLRASGLYSAYLAAVPRQATVALTQYLGMDINQAKVKELQGKLCDQIAVLQAEIEGIDIVKKYIKDKPVKYKDKEPFNPMGDDAIVLFRDYLKREEIQVKDGSKTRWSVDKRILEKIDHPLARLIVSLRNKSKMKSTYVDGLELGKGKYVWPDGKIHTNFHTTFTTTSRFSSDEPNFQNFPNRNDAWIREQIVAPEGHVIVAADYGQLEMCGAAMCSKDPVLIKVLWDDYDTHMKWSSKLAKLCPERVGGDFNDPKVAKAFRSLVKNKIVFPAIYGASNASMAGYMGIEEHYIDTLMDEFWDTFKGIKRWQKRLLDDYRETGFVESPTGRRRHHPLTSNEAINAPIQCLASEIVVDAMNRLSFIAATENKWHLHPRLNIHDDLSMVVPEKKLVSSIETIYKTMLTPTLSKKIINVPLSVEVAIGKNWYNMTSIGKFWSHKDL